MNPQQFQKHCELQALWWIASATTGHCKTRQITRGDGTPLTDDEKVADALETAQTHIKLFRESCESVLTPPLDLEEVNQRMDTYPVKNTSPNSDTQPAGPEAGLTPAEWTILRDLGAVTAVIIKNRADALVPGAERAGYSQFCALLTTKGSRRVLLSTDCIFRTEAEAIQHSNDVVVACVKWGKLGMPPIE